MSTVSKFLPQTADNFSTQIASATVSSSALTFNVDDASGLPTEGVGQFFKKDADGEIVTGSIEFIHWTGVSGNTITLTDVGDRGLTGSDAGAQSYVADDYFECWVSTYYQPATGILVEHEADGTHSASLTLTTPTLTSPTITTPKVTTAYPIGTAGATETVNWANGDRQTMTLDENITITFSNAAAGQTLTLYMLQDGTGTNTIAWADTITWQDGATWGTAYYSTAANKMNVVTIFYNGSAYFGMSGKYA